MSQKCVCVNVNTTEPVTAVTRQPPPLQRVIITHKAQTRPLHRRMRLACCTFMLCAAGAQFGNLEIKWETSANGASRPRVAEDQHVEFVPPEHVRKVSLSELPVSALTDIMTGLGASCETCATRGHWLSRVRAACLEMGPKALKKSLNDRGVKCEGCTMREHYLDRLLDSLHLPRVNR